MRKILILLSVIFLLVGCTSNYINENNDSNKNDNKKEFEDRDYVVGIDNTFIPMTFKDENDNITGFDIEIARKIANIMGINIKFQPIEWSTKETELNAKNIDFIWSGYSITDARKEKVLFSIPYLETRQVIVVMKSSDIMKKDDLKNKTVTCQSESSALYSIKADSKFNDALNGKAPKEFPTYKECFEDLEALRCDAIVIDEVFAKYYISQNKDKSYRILNEDFGQESYAIGVRKEDEFLKEKLNDSLEKLKNDGDFDKIYEKWFSEK